MAGRILSLAPLQRRSERPRRWRSASAGPAGPPALLARRLRHPLRPHRLQPDRMPTPAARASTCSCAATGTAAARCCTSPAARATRRRSTSRTCASAALSSAPTRCTCTSWPRPRRSAASHLRPARRPVRRTERRARRRGAPRTQAPSPTRIRRRSGSEMTSLIQLRKTRTRPAGCRRGSPAGRGVRRPLAQQVE